MVRNPVIPGFNPDPSVVRAGDRLVAVTSSFEYRPGVPVYTSLDLETWELVGHVVDSPDAMAPDPMSSGGAWAPTIRYRDGTFYVIVTDAKGGRGNLLFRATDPAGPWSAPVEIPIEGIDPDLAWGSDGTCYVTYAALHFRPHLVHLGIQQVAIDSETGALLEDPRLMWNGTGLKIPEAPHVYEIDGWWYLVIAEGGTDHGHSVSIARSRSVTGPFEGCPSNPVLSARSTPRAVQNTGHGDLVLGPDGSWKMMLLGTRNCGRGFSPLGRETFLTSVVWEDGWPIVAPVEMDADATQDPVVDEFSTGSLRPEWIALRRFPNEVASIDGGQLCMRGEGSTMDNPKPIFLGRRVGQLESRIELAVANCTGVGGLTIRLDEDHHYDIEIRGAEIVARSRVGTMTDERCQDFEVGPVVLFAESGRSASTGWMSPDDITLGFISGGGRVDLATFDGRYLTTETACAFTGRVAGPYCVSETLVVDRYSEASLAQPRPNAGNQ